ncbi:hypothetical protein HGRIS_014845 [Hohenbuehelia grisea]|uniref:Uncharacterized protein n=1 Tax=Hohenbuehelia grisea TaxID=104357 RepID=A0ABR3IQX5_9AGAR
MVWKLHVQWVFGHRTEVPSVSSFWSMNPSRASVCSTEPAPSLEEYAAEGTVPYFDECVRLLQNRPGGLIHLMDDQVRWMPDAISTAPTPTPQVQTSCPWCAVRGVVTYTVEGSLINLVKGLFSAKAMQAHRRN